MNIQISSLLFHSICENLFIKFFPFSDWKLCSFFDKRKYSELILSFVTQRRKLSQNQPTLRVPPDVDGSKCWKHHTITRNKFAKEYIFLVRVDKRASSIDNSVFLLDNLCKRKKLSERQFTFFYPKAFHSH